MKAINSENWLTHDPAMNVFGAFSDNSPDTPKGGGRLVQQITAPQLSKTTPEGVRYLFEMARGALCYGALFYPLYTLGIEQIFRCLDEALRQRLEIEQPRTVPKVFSQRISMAKSLGLIEAKDTLRWDNIRQLRNAGAHSDGRSIFSPGDAINSLLIASELISHLFEKRA